MCFAPRIRYLPITWYVALSTMVVAVARVSILYTESALGSAQAQLRHDARVRVVQLLTHTRRLHITHAS